MKSNRRKKQKCCRGKSRHRTKEGATISIKRITAKSFIFHRMHPYKCRYCGYWHVGKSKEIMYEKFNELIK